MNDLSPQRRQSYLDALEIDTWRLRGAHSVDEEAEPVEAPADEPREAGVEEANWTSLRSAVSGCQRCVLHTSRTQTVFGVGNPDAEWMIIGEAPGAEEDRRGEPFVGRAGQLLDEILRSVGLDRDRVFIANILKCRPPNNRDPGVDEATACRPYLDRQIALVKPRLILAVGRIAAQQLTGSDAPIGRMRGQLYRAGPDDTPMVVTYHPAYLLRSPAQKRKVWEDLCLARRTLRQ